MRNKLSPHQKKKRHTIVNARECMQNISQLTQNQKAKNKQCIKEAEDDCGCHTIAAEMDAEYK